LFIIFYSYQLLYHHYLVGYIVYRSSFFNRLCHSVSGFLDVSFTTAEKPDLTFKLKSINQEHKFTSFCFSHTRILLFCRCCNIYFVYDEIMSRDGLLQKKRQSNSDVQRASCPWVGVRISVCPYKHYDFLNN